MKATRWIVDADKLSARRIARGMTTAALARRAGIAERTLGRYQTGPQRLAELEPLRCIARVLGVPIEAIAAPSEPAPPAVAPDVVAPPVERARLLARTQLESIVAIEARVPPPRPVPHEGTLFPVLTARKLQGIFSAFATFQGERFAIPGLVAKHRGASPLEAKMIGSEQGIAVRFLLVRSITDGVDVRITVHTAKARDTRLLLKAFEEEREACAIAKVVLAPHDTRAEGVGFDFFLSPKPLPWALVVEGVA